MADACVCPIVEGHGEYEAVRLLLQRIWTELLGGDHIEVLRPIRQSRGRLLIAKELEKAVVLAGSKLAQSLDLVSTKLVLVLVDAEDDLPCLLAPRLQAVVSGVCRAGQRSACVVANIMYETWFVAAAESLGDFLDVSLEKEIPDDPEQHGYGKGWIKERFRRPKYSETVDQPAMTSAMDLALCRRRSRSFDKLCRELEKLRD